MYGFFENVGSLASQPESWKRVLSTLNDLGYRCRWCIIPVPDGLIHRERFFLLATKREVGDFPATHALRDKAAMQPPWTGDWPVAEQRMLPRSSYRCVQHRLTMMGNIMVPHQGCVAFDLLCGS